VDRIRKFSAAERWVHWGIAVTFFVLLLTGLPLFSHRWFGWLGPLFGGPYGARVIHHWAGGTFLALLVLAVIGGFRAWVAQVFRWDADDRAWRRHVLRHFLGLADYRRMPPQGKYNAGQKAWSVSLLAGGFVLGASGLVMLFPHLFPTGLVRWMYPLHGLVAMGLAALLVGHVFLAAFHRETRRSLESMTTGWVDADYVAAHHSKWLEELGSRGQRRTGQPGAAEAGPGGQSSRG